MSRERRSVGRPRSPRVMRQSAAGSKVKTEVMSYPCSARVFVCVRAPAHVTVLRNTLVVQGLDSCENLLLSSPNLILLTKTTSGSSTHRMSAKNVEWMMFRGAVALRPFVATDEPWESFSMIATFAKLYICPVR